MATPRWVIIAAKDFQDQPRLARAPIVGASLRTISSLEYSVGLSSGGAAGACSNIAFKLSNTS